MPYSITSENLPEYVKNKPDSIKKKWVAIFNEVYMDEGEEQAFIVANSWLKRELEKYKSYVARTEGALERIPLELQMDRDVIVRSENGDEFVSFKLADTFKDRFGVSLTPDILQKWADAINSGDVFLGDIDHETYNRYAQAPVSDEEFDYFVKNKQNSIAKAVKAVVDKGRLWVKAIIDKRYKKLINKSKGVSMEAVIKRHPVTNSILDADLLGFTFGVNDTPAIEGTEVYGSAA